MSTRHSTAYPGVYQREAEGRTFKGKPDVGFDITYRHEGRKIWERVGWLSEGYSAKVAADILAERKRSMRHGEELPQEKAKAPFLRDVWGKYKQWAQTNKSHQGRDDLSQYKNHIQERFADRRLNEISSFDLERMKAELAKEGLSPASVRHRLVLMRQIFNKAIAWGMYKGANPIKGVKLPILQNQRTRFLSFDEATRLLDHLRVDPHIKKPETRAKATPTALHDLALLSLHTGMRAGECFALKGQDLDFANGIITIRDPKNKSTRHAYMTAAVKEMLRRREPESPSSLVFPDQKGKQAQTISQAFRRAIVSLGFNKGVQDPREKVTFHTLRHTFASWLAIEGTPIFTIAKLMGHKSIAMSERYSHLSPDHKRQAIANLEKAMTGKRNAIVSPGQKGA